MVASSPLSKHDLSFNKIHGVRRISEKAFALVDEQFVKIYDFHVLKEAVDIQRHFCSDVQDFWDIVPESSLREIQVSE